MKDQRKLTLVRYKKFKAKRDAEHKETPEQSRLPHVQLRGSDFWDNIRAKLVLRSGGKCECKGGCERKGYHIFSHPMRADNIVSFELFCRNCYEAASNKVSVTEQPPCCASLPR